MGFVEKTIEDIKELRIQGARSAAISGLKTLRRVDAEDGFGRNFERVCTLLIKARPTAVPLYNAIKIIRKKKTMESIDNLIYYFENVGSIIATNGLKIVKNNSVVLTHCHSTVVVEMLRKAWEKKRKFEVIVTETRPLYQGYMTAKELSEVGVPVTFIIDSAAGYFIDKVDCLIVGSDAVRKEGVINKIGTYPLAVLCKENKIPIYFVCETMKFDRRKNIVIEERSPNEIVEKKLKRCKIRNPAFDITPWKYVTALITEKGVMKHEQVLKELKLSSKVQ